jgi:predicted MFS family arabinose efflux permease
MSEATASNTHSPDITRLLALSGTLNAADQIALAALPLTAVLALGAGPGLVGLVVAAQTAAWLLVSLPGGALVDRAQPHRVLHLAIGLAVTGCALATGAAVSGHVGLLAAGAFLGAAGTVLFALVQVSLAPALAGPAALPRLNARFEFLRALAMALAPIMAGWLATHAGPGTPYGLALAAALAALLLGATWRVPGRGHAAPRGPLLPLLAEGARFVAATPLLRAIGLCAIAWNFAYMALAAIFVPFALTQLGVDAFAAGLAMGMGGAGMILGALAAPALMARVTPAFILVFGPLSSCLAVLLLLVAPRAPTPHGAALAGLAYFAIGFGPMLWLIMQTSLRQIVTPARLIGRVSATIQTAIYGVRPFGALAGGAVAATFGLHAAMVLVACAFAASALAAIASPLARLRAMPARAPEP